MTPFLPFLFPVSLLRIPGCTLPFSLSSHTFGPSIACYPPHEAACVQLENRHVVASPSSYEQYVYVPANLGR